MINPNVFANLYGVSEAAVTMMTQYYNAAYNIVKTKYRKPKSDEVLEMAYRLMEIQTLIANCLTTGLQANQSYCSDTNCGCANQNQETDDGNEDTISFV